MHVHHQSAMMRPSAGTTRASWGRAAGDAEHNSVGADLAAEEDPLDNWKYLMSLVKAKLLNNNGKGRKITILCGGMLCMTYERTLRRYPGTLLTSMIMEEDGALFYSDKLILDRHPLAFVEILNSYREGVIAEQPPHIAPETWIHELTYFRMHCAKIPAINNLLENYGIFLRKGQGKNPLHGLSPWAAAVYRLVEEPSSSWPARIFWVISMSIIIMAVTMVCVETLPEVSSSESMQQHLFIVESVIIGFFTIEFLARFLVCNDKKRFLTRPLNIMDVAAIFPYFLVLVIPASVANKNSGNWVSSLPRLLRILRIFKLSRHSSGLQVLFDTAKACKEELIMLLFCLLMFSLLFSALLFFAEDGQDGGFDSECIVMCICSILLLYAYALREDLHSPVRLCAPSHPSTRTFAVDVIAYMCRHPAQHVVGRCDDHDGKNSVI